MLGTKFNYSIYLSLVVIVGGVLLTTATMEVFNLYGLCAAVFSTMSLAVQSIFSKKVMKGIDHLNLLLGTSQLCFVALFPFWYVHEGHNMIFGDGLKGLGNSIEFSGVFLELIGAAIANCTQTIVAFTFLSLVHPVSYAVANVAKRVIVIGGSMVFLGEMGSLWNLMGMATTLSGIALYSKLKLDDKLANDAKGKLVLPIHTTQGDAWL